MLGELGLFGAGPPAFLSDVISEHLASYFGGEFAVDASVVTTVEAGAITRATVVLSRHSSTPVGNNGPFL
jgi:hypothetical protein